MEEKDAREAEAIVQRAMRHLAETIATTGEQGANARSAIGLVNANAYIWLRADQLGPPLQNAFDLCLQAGATQPAIDQVRVWTDIEQPITLGGVLMQNSIIQFCLALESEIIAGTKFISRQDVDALLKAIRTPFSNAVEIAADEMDQATYMALVELQASLTNHLVVTAIPLPQLVGYQFTDVLPSLVIAYRLYADAGRADQIRAENKIIHPAFCPPSGLALSM